MNDKNIRYTAWGVNSLAVIAILLLNDASFSRSGLFTTEINYTLLYKFLYQKITYFFGYSSTVIFWIYFLWFSCLGGGVFLSWKGRFITGKIFSKMFKSIHEKI